MGLEPEVKLIVKHTFLEYVDDDKLASGDASACRLTRQRSQTEPAIMTNPSYDDVLYGPGLGCEISSSSSHTTESCMPLVLSTPEATPLHFPVARHMPELLQEEWVEGLLPEAYLCPQVMDGCCQYYEQYPMCGWWAPGQFASDNMLQDGSCTLQGTMACEQQFQVYLPMPANSDCVTASHVKREVMQASASAVTGDVKESRTTVMLRDLPEAYSRSHLLKLLDTQGFFGRFDFIYLPVDFKSQKNLGYALINLVSPSEALRLTSHFKGFSDWGVAHEHVCSVGWCSPQQGLEAHVERYRNSPVMHESVPEEWRPMLLSHGVPIPFPAPTLKIKAPKVKGRQS